RAPSIAPGSTSTSTLACPGVTSATESTRTPAPRSRSAGSRSAGRFTPKTVSRARSPGRTRPGCSPRSLGSDPTRSSSTSTPSSRSGPAQAGMEPEKHWLRSHALECAAHAELVVRTRVPAAVHALPVTLHEHDLAELAELVAFRGGGASPPLVARVDEPLPRA